MVQSNKFKNEFTFEKRLEESTKIREKHSERIPIIVTKAKNCKLKEMDKYKFLAPYDLTLGQFLLVIRKRINPGKPLFCNMYTDHEKYPNLPKLPNTLEDSLEMLNFNTVMKNAFGKNVLNSYNNNRKDLQSETSYVFQLYFRNLR